MAALSDRFKESLSIVLRGDCGGADMGDSGFRGDFGGEVAKLGFPSKQSFTCTVISCPILATIEKN